MKSGRSLLASLALAAPHPSAEQIHAKSAEIMARSEFDPTPRENFWLKILRDIFQWLGQLYYVSPVLYWIMLIGCVSLLILIIGHIVYTLYRALTFSESAKDATGRATRQRLSAKYASEAKSAAEAGNFTEAIRLLFLALVFRFDEAGRVPLRKSLTNHEYLNLLDDRLSVRSDLLVMVDAIDQYWYGQQAANVKQYENCQAIYDRLMKP